MTVYRQHHYVLTCDDCAETGGHDGGHDYGTTVYFATDQAALDWATDNSWTITATGHIRCPRCTAQAFCADLGHIWGPWQPCPCRGRIRAHQRHGCPLMRHCDQCCHYETATPASTPAATRTQPPVT